MKTVGIIAEYNPFHLGHRYHLQYVREELGADYIVVAMSGDYVQRGTPALFPKHIRAKAALLCGADLVLELPVSCSTASAEFFSRAGVDLLDKLGVTDMLCFGSEKGKSNLFALAAQTLIEEPKDFKVYLKEQLKMGKTFPSARANALLFYLEKHKKDLSIQELSSFLSRPNNILGIEYVKAIRTLNSKILPVTFLRQGADYHDSKLSTESFSSATAIRNLIKESHTLKNTSEYIQSYLPPEVFYLFKDALIQKEFLLEEDFDLLLHFRLLSMGLEDMEACLDVSPELARRIINRLNRYDGYLSFASDLKTKDMTQTRIQRALLHLLLNIQNVPKSIPYARVLGLKKDASPLLKEIKKKSRIPLITKPADAYQMLEQTGLKLLEETTYASNVYESLLCKKAERSFVHEYQKPAIIL